MYRGTDLGTNVYLANMENVNILLDNHQIEKVTKFKYLDLILDNQLTLSQHVDYIKSKTIAKIRLLSMLSYILDRKPLLAHQDAQI